MKNITNIKISCIFKLPVNWKSLLNVIIEKRKIVCKKSANIIVIRDKYVFCIFERKDLNIHFNVTKIHSIPDIFDFLFFFSEHYFSYETKLLSLKIDNITANFDIKKKIDFKNLKFINDVKIRFNPERFSGYFLKFNQGTVILFRNGKINIVGCKSISNIHEICRVLEKNLHVNMI